MNIDTTVISTGSEKNNYIAAYQNSKNQSNEAFKFQLESISSSKTETADKEVQAVESDTKEVQAKEETSSDDDAKVSSKGEDKAQKTENTKDNQVKNEAQEENAQNQSGQNSQNGQNQQNPQSAMLSDEIAEMLKLNTKSNGINQINNASFKAGISEDIFTNSAKIDYASIAMSDGDALFFANLVTKTDMTMSSIAGEFQKSLNNAKVQEVQKTAKVSSVLMDALADSMKTGKAFRIDFDKDVSVVMRVDKDGNLNANFIPGDKAVEAYLRNNISYLRSRFDEENLPYNELTYSKYKEREQESEKRKDKENDNE